MFALRFVIKKKKKQNKTKQKQNKNLSLKYVFFEEWDRMSKYSTLMLSTVLSAGK